MSKYLSLLFLLIIFISNTYAQRNDLRFKHLTKENGLSQSTVYAIAEDKYGFIWIGTVDGLNRYDGYNLKIYSYSQDDTMSLANNRIYSLLLDNEGILWVATLGGGLCRYNYATDNFTTYKSQKNNINSLGNDVVMSLHQDKDGFIWVGTAEGGFSRFDKKTASFKTYKNDPTNSNSLINNTVISITEDSDSNLWLATSTSGICRFNKRTEIFTSFKNDANNSNSLSSNTVNSVHVDKQNTLWVSTDNGINKFDRNTGNFKRFINEPLNPKSLPSNFTYRVFEDRSNNLWVATYGGLSRITKENRVNFTFDNFENDAFDVESLNNNLIRCIFQDRSGIMWIGTYSGGVNSFLPDGEKFSRYHLHPNKVNSLSHNAVRCFCQDKEGNIWIGTYGGGVDKFDPKTETFTNFKNNTSNNSLVSNLITSIVCDDQDNIWIGTNKGLDKFSKKSQKFIHFKYNEKDNKTISNNNIRSLLIDHEGLIWIATSGGGVNCYNQTTGQFIHYQNKKNDSTSFSDKRAMGLFEDSDGNIWIGTSSRGLNKFDRKTGKFEHFYYNEKNNTGINTDRVFCIYEATYRNEKEIWVGTGGGGLNKLNLKTKKFEHYTKKNGLPSNVIMGIMSDENGILWLTTSNGLVKMNPKGDSLTMFKVYDEKEGLLSNEFNENAYFKDKDGNIYVGGNNGFNVFHPSKVKDNPNVPPIYLIDFSLFNSHVEIGENSLLSKSIIETDFLDLSYRDYVFSFEITALNFTNPDKNTFMYFMDGFDKDWTLINSKRRNITYTNLEPGTYTFKVKAANNDGIWNETPRELKIVIEPPFWKTLWFKISVILFIITSFYLFYSLRLRSLKRSKVVLEETVRIRTEEIFQQKEEIQAQAEQLFEYSKELEKLSVVASKTDNAVLIMDSSGNFEWVNEGFVKLYGYTLEAFIKKFGKNLTETSINQDIKNLLAICFADKKSFTYESSVINASNNKLWLHTNITPILDNNEQIIKLIAIETDITLIKEAQQEIVRQSEEIATQRDNLQILNTQINNQNEKIQSSIKYALTIQKATLPIKQHIDKHFDNFLIYQPKDIVSGDFYWFSTLENENKIFVAVVDCTGHGVPGAFMSMIGSRLLSNIVNEKRIFNPALILETLSCEIRAALKQDQTENNDGMDVCLCCIERSISENQGITINFAGAKRPLYYLDSNAHEIKSLRGNSRTIGGKIMPRIENPFTTQHIVLQQNDIIYLSSDGYIDQCSPQRVKFGPKHFQNIAIQCVDLPLNEQKQYFENELKKHSQNEPQRDDITILAIKL